MRIYVTLLSGKELVGCELGSASDDAEVVTNVEIVKGEVERILAAEGQGFLVIEGDQSYGQFAWKDTGEAVVPGPAWHCIPTRSIDFVTVR